MNKKRLKIRRVATKIVKEMYLEIEGWEPRFNQIKREVKMVERILDEEIKWIIEG